ncbi:MAG: GAF domain-containing protein [Bacteroidales bacterium]
MSYRRKIHKITGVISFFLLIISAVILMANARNLSVEYENVNIPLSTIYLLSVLIILLAVINFVQIINLTTEKAYKEDYTEKSDLKEIYETEEKQPVADKVRDDQDNDYNLEAIEQKLLPAETENSEDFCEQILRNIANEYDIVQGLFYIRKNESDSFTICGKYAYYGAEEPKDFELGVSLTGQTAKNQRVMNITKIPENYTTILSGLGSDSPESLLLIPIIQQERTIALIELASFKNFDKKTENIFNELSNVIGNELATIIT